MSQESLLRAADLEDGSLGLRPVRTAPVGKVQAMTDADKHFLKYLEEEDIEIRYLPDKKPAHTTSGARYRAYQVATTIREARSLGMTQGDLLWNWERGFFIVPGLEPRTLAHYCREKDVYAVFGKEVAEINKSMHYWNRRSMPAYVPSRHLTVLDMFAGTKSAQSEVERRGWNYLSMDSDPTRGCTFTEDVMTWDYKSDLQGVRVDIVLAGPPCTLFSRMRRLKRTRDSLSRKRGYKVTVSDIEAEMYKFGVPIVQRTLEIIRWMQENCGTKAFVIENPATGFLHRFIDITPYLVDYC